MAFHIHVPKPLHGWKAFFNEIFVIVIGVLIALGLEAGVEWLHWQHKVEDGRERLRGELKRAYITSSWDVTFTPCVLAQLNHIRDNLLDPSAPPMPVDHFMGNDAVLRTPTGVARTGTWTALQNDGTLLHFPIKQQNRLNAIYQLIENKNTESRETRQTSIRLIATSYKGPLPEQLRASLLEQVAAQYGRSQGLALSAIAIMSMLKSEGYAASDAEVDASLQPNKQSPFHTPTYCREQKLPMADWKSELQKAAATVRPQ